MASDSRTMNASFGSPHGESASAAGGAAANFKGDDVKLYNSFDDMDLPEHLLRGVYSYGYERPSVIQSKAIVPMREGHDILAQAQSGTGKTGAFTIGSLCRVDPNLKRVQVLILVPVRELANQILKVVKQISAHMGISVYAATGGPPIRDDIRAIERGAQFLIGTPGRIFDLMTRDILQRDHIRVLIFDEADQMLEDRFREQVKCILKKGFPKDVQVALFSATMDEEVIGVANELLGNPVRILIEPHEVPLDGIKQYYVELEKEEWKFETLCDLYSHLTISQAFIYCNKRQRAEWLAEKMGAQGFPISFIHGEMPVEERKLRMDKFCEGEDRVLIATDMLARGIDVQQVSLVINFELPTDRANYIHRIGRAGRYGRKGITINLISPEDKRALSEIETFFKVKMEQLPTDLASLK
jgi:translation initiation factor 4A